MWLQSLGIETVFPFSPLAAVEPRMSVDYLVVLAERMLMLLRARDGSTLQQLVRVDG